ncbi:uncharacterized PE-PGRS family protein PE_PGRS36-like [Parasteatoda tepidariorum]|uniref:uncharacterized PE-PGRS family protein PE_PGRS36-like n=1 Tax=Parasteatoda tepidariorum TaxID=114398 RepID=UPI001C718C7D|nr:uncharacterized protein LOC107444304 [Parasteatoda tepidariorum]
MVAFLGIRGKMVVGIMTNKMAGEGMNGGSDDPISGEPMLHKPYSFEYKAPVLIGNIYHSEKKDGNGKVSGSYGYTDAQGLYRQVDYVADEHGFRAIVKTNEPGTSRREEDGVAADVVLQSDSPPAGLQEGFSKSEESGQGKRPLIDMIAMDSMRGGMGDAMGEQGGIRDGGMGKIVGFMNGKMGVIMDGKMGDIIDRGMGKTGGIADGEMGAVMGGKMDSIIDRGMGKMGGIVDGEMGKKDSIIYRGMGKMGDIMDGEINNMGGIMDGGMVKMDGSMGREMGIIMDGEFGKKGGTVDGGMGKMGSSNAGEMGGVMDWKWEKIGGIVDEGIGKMGSNMDRDTGKIGGIVNGGMGSINNEWHVNKNVG